MKSRRMLYPVVVMALAIASFTAACNKQQTRSDAQVAADVQSKFNSDQAIQNKQISVAAAKGVVTLSGNVNTDAERTAAANDAAAVEGVRTVVNNLQVQQAQAQPVPETPPVLSQSDETEQARANQKERDRKPSASTTTRRQSDRGAKNQQNYNSTPQQQQNQQASNIAPAPAAPAQPTPPPPPAKVTIPEGTAISVRLTDTVDSETANVGDTFRGTLNSPVVVNDDVVIPADADVVGQVTDAKAAGRFAGQSSLGIQLTKVSFNGKTYQIHTNTWSKQGSSRGKSTATKVGAGAALGAIIGGIAGGGKGAAIGGLAGAGAGTGVQAATKGAQIKLGPESLLSFKLESPVTVTPASENQRNAGRERLPQ